MADRSAYSHKRRKGAGARERALDRWRAQRNVSFQQQIELSIKQRFEDLGNIEYLDGFDEFEESYLDCTGVEPDYDDYDYVDGYEPGELVFETHDDVSRVFGSWVPNEIRDHYREAERYFRFVEPSEVVNAPCGQLIEVVEDIDTILTNVEAVLPTIVEQQEVFLTAIETTTEVRTSVLSKFNEDGQVPIEDQIQVKLTYLTSLLEEISTSRNFALAKLAQEVRNYTDQLSRAIQLISQYDIAWYTERRAGPKEVSRAYDYNRWRRMAPHLFGYLKFVGSHSYISRSVCVYKQTPAIILSRVDDAFKCAVPETPTRYRVVVAKLAHTGPCASYVFSKGVT